MILYHIQCYIYTYIQRSFVGSLRLSVYIICLCAYINTPDIPVNLPTCLPTPWPTYAPKYLHSFVPTHHRSFIPGCVPTCVNACIIRKYYERHIYNTCLSFVAYMRYVVLTLPCMFENICENTCLFVMQEYRISIRFFTRYCQILPRWHHGTVQLWGGVLHGACRQPTTTMPFFSDAFHCGARMPKGLKNAQAQTYSRRRKMFCIKYLYYMRVMLGLEACWNRRWNLPREEFCKIARDRPWPS